MYGNGNFMSSMDAFDIAGNKYDSPNSFPDLLSSESNGPGAPFVSDTNGNIYAFSNYSVDMWNASTNKWTQLLDNTYLYGYSAAAAFDSKRNRFLILGGSRSPGTAIGSVYDVATKTMSAKKFSGLSDSVFDKVGGALIYDSNLDSFFFRSADTSGSAVVKIDAATLNVSNFSVIGGSSAPAPVNGLWKRWLYSPQLGGVFYIPSYASNIWFLRLR